MWSPPNSLAAGSRVDLLGNTLALVGPSGGVDIAAPEDLLREDVGRIAMADPALAPAGAYTREAMEGLGLWEKLQPKLLYGPDVRTALQYAASGSVDAAVVYATDVVGAEGVRMLWRFPDDSHRPVRYPAAAMADADNFGGAAAFLVFLRTEEPDGVPVARLHDAVGPPPTDGMRLGRVGRTPLPFVQPIAKGCHVLPTP